MTIRPVPSCPKSPAVPEAEAVSVAGPAVFAPVVGQFDNLGDVMLRRRFVTWTRDLGQPHIFVGAAPRRFVEGVGLRSSDTVYTSFARWYLALLRSALTRPTVYAFKPGEIQLSASGAKEHLLMLPALAVMRLRGHYVVRVGSGIRDGRSRFWRAVVMPSVWLSHVIWWRDDESRRVFGSGAVAPDFAYGEGSTAATAGTAARDLLLLSLRGDRMPPPDALVKALVHLADESGLRIGIVAQVDRDRELATRLGAQMSADVLLLDDGAAAFEDELRAVYRRSAAVVSDRLHALIAGVTEGCVPVGVAFGADHKLGRHLAPAEFTRHVVTVGDGDTPEQIEGALAEVMATGDVWPRVAAARVRLDAVLDGVRETVRRRATPTSFARVTVYHLGRSGEVAGGMTQVVNNYLSWDFNHTRSALVRTRGVSGPRALLTYAAALRRMLLLPRASSVVVGHVSQGGSFVREGALMLVAKQRGLPVVAYLHGSRFAPFAARRPRLVRRVLGACDAVFVLSAPMAEVVSTICPGIRVELVPNTVVRGRSTPKENLVVFAGAVCRRKGADVLVEAWRRLGSTAGWRLVLAGPRTDDAVSGVDEATAEGSIEGIELPGAVPHEQLMDLLDRARIAVLPSRDEAMPLFLLESMARRVAVIGTTVGGVPELLADSAGQLVAPGEVEQLAEAMKGLLDDPDGLAALAARGSARYEEHYSPEAVFARAEGVFLDLARGNKIRSDEPMRPTVRDHS